jgi:23S rRNA pseudouridine1911/1915/1917 synthase
VLFALNDRARAALVAQFAERSPERVYLAVVWGRPDPPAGTWHDRLIWDEEACLQREAHTDDPGARDALSDYRLVEAFKEASLLEIRLQTGRQGQIRVQAQLRGHALVGDRRYASRGGVREGGVSFPRQALHASCLAFAHPSGGHRLELTVPPPGDLRKLLTALRHGR